MRRCLLLLLLAAPLYAAPPKPPRIVLLVEKPRRVTKTWFFKTCARLYPNATKAELMALRKEFKWPGKCWLHPPHGPGRTYALETGRTKLSIGHPVPPYRFWISLRAIDRTVPTVDYRHIGKMLGEFMADDVVAIWFPETRTSYQIDLPRPDGTWDASTRASRIPSYKRKLQNGHPLITFGMRKEELPDVPVARKPEPEPRGVPRATLVPRWRAGEMTRCKVVVTRNASVDAGIVKGNIVNTWTLEYAETITKASKGFPTEAKRQFTKHRWREVRKISGKTATENKRHPLEGRTIDLERKSTLLEPFVDPPRLEPLEIGTHGLDWSWILPGDEVDVGDTWSVEGGWEHASVLTRFVADTIRFRLESIRLGGKRARIEIIGSKEVSGTFDVDLSTGKVVRAEIKEKSDDGRTKIETRVFFERRLN